VVNDSILSSTARSGLCATSSSPSRSGCALMLIFLFFRRTLGARDTMSGPAIVALGLAAYLAVFQYELLPAPDIPPGARLIGSRSS